ncbi:MAG: DUF3363 domain-containing protein [Candidatus Omnitrophica bacterium]|nr:DUF3363 domain-containing protein [Candidatus Omnitrophota bacterium]
MNKNLPFEDFKLGPKKPKKYKFFNSAKDRYFFKNQLKKLTKASNSFALFSGQKEYYQGQYSYFNGRYLTNKYPNQWAAHGRYLQRKGAQKQDERGLGFDYDHDDIPIAKLLSSWQKSGDERLWKFIISPEAGYRVDLKDHARQFMERLEKDLGRKLEWVAIDHYNTDDFHLHFCVRGIDKSGVEYRLDEDYIKEGPRKISKQLLTEKLGLRTDDFIIERRNMVLFVEHVTELDRIIEKNLNSDHFITIPHGADSSVDQVKRSQMLMRLEFLKSLGVAHKHSAATFYVEPTFISFLKFKQEQKDISKVLSKHKGQMLDSDLPIVVNKLPNVGDRLIGRVVSSGINERFEDYRYVLVEGIDGQAHYITTNTKLMDLRDNWKLLNGQVVCLERREFIKEDKKISYIRVEGFNDFEAVRQSPVVNNVDRYIVEKMIENGKAPQDGISDNKVRKEFLDIIVDRIELLKSRNILNDDLELNRHNLEVYLRKTYAKQRQGREN